MPGVFDGRPSIGRNWLVLIAGAMLFLTAASRGVAHDFWIIPDIFTFASDSTVHITARSGTRFPAGSPVAAARIAEARVIGASSDEKISDFAVDGTALRLHYKPSTAGQYLVAVALTAPQRQNRTLGSQLIRFLRAEGGAGEADRLERGNTFAATDSIEYASRSYAATVVQVGRGGPTTFSRTAGYPLEFVPRQNPLHLHVSDTLHVKMVSFGKNVAEISIEATPAADTLVAADPAAPSRTVRLATDSKGILHLPLTSPGRWILRSAYVIKRAGEGIPTFDVARATYTFSVTAPHSSTSH